MYAGAGYSALCRGKRIAIRIQCDALLELKLKSAVFSCRMHAWLTFYIPSTMYPFSRPNFTFQATRERVANGYVRGEAMRCNALCPLPNFPCACIAMWYGNTAVECYYAKRIFHTTSVVVAKQIEIKSEVLPFLGEFDHWLNRETP